MTTSTLPMDALAALPAAHDPRPQRLQLRFTASGSEYFRIWIVNLLLTLITASLYLPWAKTRRLRYFYGNTLIAGQPLDFHGEPSRMLRGHLLTGAMFLLYGVANRVSPAAAGVAILVLAAVWPALFRAAMQFRLSNTSWRGLRFEFTGSLGGAYGALLPLFTPALLFAAVGMLAAGVGKSSTAAGVLIVAGGIASMLLFPWCLYRLKRYQHEHYRLGQWQTRFDLGVGRFYGLFFKIGALGVGMMVLAGIVVAVLLPHLPAGTGGADMARMVTAMAVGYVAFLLVYLSILEPYSTSRMQNLIWSHTASPQLRFESRLKALPLIALSLKNWGLMLLTAGLYWPFATVAVKRMRLEAVSLNLSDSPNQLLAGTGRIHRDASGDAAGDFFGIDIGL